MRYLYGQQQKRGKTANDLIPAKDIQDVFDRQLGKVHGTYAFNHLHSTVHDKNGATVREIANWYFGQVSCSQGGSAGRRSALLIIDVQNDFCPPDGSLAVGDGLTIIPIINDLRKRVHFNSIAHTQDFHPADHISFASNNKDNPECRLLHHYDCLMEICRSCGQITVCKALMALNFIKI